MLSCGDEKAGGTGKQEGRLLGLYNTDSPSQGHRAAMAQRSHSSHPGKPTTAPGRRQRRFATPSLSAHSRQAPIARLGDDRPVWQLKPLVFRLLWTLAPLAAGAPLMAQAAPPEPLSASQLDWQPYDEVPQGKLCSGRYVTPAYRIEAGDTPEQVTTSADKANYGNDGVATLMGEVVLRRGDSQLESPEVSVNEARDTATAKGPVTYRQPGVLLRGDDARVSLNSDAASVDNGHYVFHEQHVRGDAVQLARLEDGRYRLKDASFTSCEPGNSLWRLVGSDITIDQDSGWGTAKHARMEMGGVPVFYWPYVRFPVDDRRHTGLLWPQFSYTSSSGFDYAQPIYLNLAPNYDATLTPRYISERGEMLEGEFRYLLPRGEEGSIEGAWLADDDGGSDPDDDEEDLIGEDRWYINYQHAGRYDARTDYQLKYGVASDGNYFDDFGRNFGETETDSLERLAQLDYHGDVWDLQFKAQGYQRMDYPLDNDDKPFYRLPSLTADGRWSQSNGFYEEWNSNATYFWRDVDETDTDIDEDQAANGSRLRLAPALGWRSDQSWSFIEPRAQLVSLSYSLDYGDRETDRSTSPSATIPVLSLDSGLIFDRETEWFGDGYTQTLEPRLYYAYVPEVDQSDLPDFDTSEDAFSWNQLWSPYRFSGGDRVGDTNKVSYGVSSRFISDESGRERLKLGVGQSSYLSDRNIDMDGDPDKTSRSDFDSYSDYYRATRDRSPVVFQADVVLNDQWTASQAVFQDFDRGVTESAQTSLRYRAEQGTVLNFGFNREIEGFVPYDDEDADDVLGYTRNEWDFSFATPMSESWSLLGRYMYDSTNSRSLEKVLGVQYNDCCYGVQVTWREWQDDNDTANTISDDEEKNGIFLTFEFKGLGGVGQSADSYLEQAVPGYRNAGF